MGAHNVSVGFSGFQVGFPSPNWRSRGWNLRFCTCKVICSVIELWVPRGSPKMPPKGGLNCSHLTTLFQIYFDVEVYCQFTQSVWYSLWVTMLSWKWYIFLSCYGKTRNVFYVLNLGYMNSIKIPSNPTSMSLFVFYSGRTPLSG